MSQASILSALFNHLCLPVRLPDREDDENIAAEVSSALGQRFLAAAKDLEESSHEDYKSALHNIQLGLLNITLVHQLGCVKRNVLIDICQKLEDGDFLLLHISAQNAGLIIRRASSSFHVDVFEACARSSDVLAAKSALQWDFPASSVSVSDDIFLNKSFLDELAHFLEQASQQLIPQFAVKVFKAAGSTPEERNSPNPSLISDVLMTLLEVNGAASNPTRIRKRIRDDASFGKKGNPWRRSPFWLVLRVGIQRQLHSLLGDDVGLTVYKFLICHTLHQLCKDVYDTPSIPLEDAAFARKKLARRLVKLSNEQLRTTGPRALASKRLFDLLKPSYISTMEAINAKIEKSSKDERSRTLKIVPKPPVQANDIELQFTLPNSGHKLRSLILAGISRHSSTVANLQRQIGSTGCSKMMDTYFAALDSENVTAPKTAGQDSGGTVPSIAQACDAVTSQLAVARTWKAGGPPPPPCWSARVLRLIELWINLDRAVLQALPLLKEYPIPFSQAMLDVLQLSSREDMQRLIKVEVYLSERDRTSRSSLPTIFKNATAQCFAVRYFDDCPEMQNLREHILKDAESASAAKVLELQEANREFNDMAEEANRLVCKNKSPEDTFHHGCRKCFLLRWKRRQRIDIFEYPLPDDTDQQKMICFELACPASFARYRDATWTIMRELDNRLPNQTASPPVQISTYWPLWKYAKNQRGMVTLASENKSFLNSHYSKLRIPGNATDICKPSGISLSYFDSKRSIWLANHDVSPSLAASCTEYLPTSSPLRNLQLNPEYIIDGTGPAANVIVASRPNCPAETSLDEYTAYQDLHCGSYLRWSRLLRELGASHLNFSSTASKIVVAQVALQVGPKQSDHDLLRQTHWVFNDPSFCHDLLVKVTEKVQSVSGNWGENQCLDSMLLLALRLQTLSTSPSITAEAEKLVAKIRATALDWARSFYSELHRIQDPKLYEGRRVDVVWASLLARKTFQYESTLATSTLPPQLLEIFVESSIILQQHLEESFESLSPQIQQALAQDWEILYRLKSKIENTIKANSSSLSKGVINAWQGSDGHSAVSLGSWTRLDGVWLVNKTKESKWSASQRIEYNYIYGHLLVNGKEIGRMPAEHRNSTLVRKLFGDQPLLTYSTREMGMEFMLAVPHYGHRLFFGKRDGETVVRARFRGLNLELVDPSVFMGHGRPDLPASLVEGCFHWLDLDSGELEIRLANEIWKTKDSNWFLDLQSRQVERHNVRHSLVNPHSHLFDRVVSTFKDFEPERYLLLYQATSREGSLTLQMSRLDVRFKSQNGVWRSEELSAEIDPDDQDAGTWYGLQSKLVLRDCHNPQLRSIIVPLGTPQLTRNDGVSRVYLIGSGNYGRYPIDPTLQRLACAAEPALIYFKALCHALTPALSPDPLTGRTGTEEALQCLQTANAQPWAPLAPCSRQALAELRRVSPFHEYYPPGTRDLRTAQWNQNIPNFAQSDAFCLLVEAIFGRSSALGSFHAQAQSHSEDESRNNFFLLERSLSRSGFAIQDDTLVNADSVEGDRLHTPRDLLESSKKRMHVAKFVAALRDSSQQLSLPQCINQHLKTWETFSGATNSFRADVLTELVDMDIKHTWLSIAHYCRESTRGDRYKLMFFFAPFVYLAITSIDLSRFLLAFALIDDVKSIPFPTHASYERYDSSDKPTESWLNSRLQQVRIPFQDAEDTDLHLGGRQRRRIQARKTSHERATAEELLKLVNEILNQWPAMELRPPEESDNEFDDELLEIDKAIGLVQDEWQRMFRNHELTTYLDAVFTALAPYKTVSPNDITLQRSSARKDLRRRSSLSCLPTLVDLIRKQSLENVDLPDALVANENFLSPANPKSPRQDSSHGRPPSHDELTRIIESFALSKNETRSLYGKDLIRSLEALKCRSHEQSTPAEPVDRFRLQQLILDFKQQILRIKSCLQGDDTWLLLGDLLPRYTTSNILQSCLTVPDKFTARVWVAVVRLALSVTTLQRLIRIEVAANTKQLHKLIAELSASGHENWNPDSEPSWLLFEIECNFLIRPKQVVVARATIAPDSRSNSVLQMNMGEGKTSCVIPLSILVLSTATSLVRVIVPRPLVYQVAQVLQTGIGGMLNRCVTHIPYSRRISTSTEQTALYESLHRSTMARCGVILTTPEHVLSFKLSGLQRLLENHLEEARPMMEFHAWLNSHSRDILDESDQTLAPQTQLIFPSGSQRAVDGHPFRWQAVQTVLLLVPSLLQRVRQKLPFALDIEQRHPKPFPTVHFLRKEGEDLFVHLLADGLIKGYGNLVALPNRSQTTLKLFRSFLLDDDIEESKVRTLERLFQQRDAEWKILLLLRGLCADRVLVLALKKKWNVQYGLSASRDPLAVPFSAKGTPSPTAEWGHPDVSILLTILSFYYAGLTKGQFKSALGHVLRAENKETIFERWVQSTPSISPSLRNICGINVDDELQLAELWRAFRYSIVVGYYFQNHFVFNLHAKQFEVKMQASGWNIPLTDHSLECLSTGFSGTNDARSILPLNIEQNDLTQLLQTNAEVLAHLLQPRNREYVRAVAADGKRLSEDGILREIFKIGSRVFIDAGAHILEYDNESMVKAWLQIDYKRPAAVFFDEDDRPMVLHRKAPKTPLLGSTYANDLSECLVYLDQRHTRGTDLRLAPNTKGVLSLDLGQSKDATMQAAFRLRQLSTTQSVVFMAPPEVDQSIRDHTGKTSNIDSSDVISWLLEQTCQMLEGTQRLFVSQGVTYCQQRQANANNPNIFSDAAHRESLVSDVKRKEDHSLKDLYRPRASDGFPLDSSAFTVPEIVGYIDHLARIRKGFMGNQTSQTQLLALQEVEQEREQEKEVEVVREIQKPPTRKPLVNEPLSPAVYQFAQGLKVNTSDDILPVFSFLANTHLGSKYDIVTQHHLHSKLFVTADFTRTVRVPKNKKDDAYLRPVEWILYNRVENSALIIGPHEADLLFPHLRKTSKTKVHLIVYAAPITRKMLHFDFGYYAIPALPAGWKAAQSIRRDLRIFAGGLFFRMEDYHDLCSFLGVRADFADGEPQESAAASALTKKPRQFLQEFLAVRRHGQDVSQTPMGYLIEGKVLDKSLPFFAED